ncbi:MAG: glycoside hydrolase family 31 protein [Armatimonadetes bacterium]|nr:glycoside hydrolase family 31 protein [Armatimonadota bacterium]
MSVKARATDRGFTIEDAEATLSVEFCAPGIIRIRKWQGEAPPVKHLIRYGFYRSDWPEVEVDSDVTSHTASARGELLRVRADASGTLTISDAAGDTLLAETEPALPGPDPGFRLRFGLSEGSRLVGLGDQTRDRINQRGTRGDLWIRNVSAYIPIPLVVSSDGFGVLLNTTRRVLYDLGATSDDWFGFECAEDSADWYFLYGPDPTEVMDRYTQVTGRPMMPPKWALGLWFICRTQADAREFTDDCLNFRREGIPCDCIGLEPGWMETNYDATINKRWSDERFRVPDYDRFRFHFFAAARRMGFKPGLWLCNDYDLSWEEERRVAPEIRAAEEQAASGFAEGYEQDEHLAGKRYQDNLTRRDVPWYDHLTHFVDEGAHWFKQDGAMQVLEHPDRLWGNGMTDAQMHNLYPLLYSRQMLQGYREHTGRRTFTFTCAGWAGLQALTGTWTGDTGGEEGPLVACLNLSLSGHGMSTCDMDVSTPAGIHFGMLLPWAQLNSWNYWRHPWLQGEQLQAVFTDYARLRYRLLPYIYSTAWLAHTTGVPMMRSMPLHWPDEAAAYDSLRQYLLGPALLVASFTDEIWLPPGDWHNFWTGERLRGGRRARPEVPEDRGGPLLAAAGAIVPMGPDMDYVGQRPEDELTVHVWAGPESSFTLYEDDGLTYEFERGAYRTTVISQRPTTGGLQVNVAAPEGDFTGAPLWGDSAAARRGNLAAATPPGSPFGPAGERDLTIVVHGLDEVTSVTLDGTPVPRGATGPRPNWSAADDGTVTVRLGRRDLSPIEVVIS